MTTQPMPSRAPCVSELVALNREACGLHRAGQIERAVALWERICEVDPTFAPAVYNLALALYRLGRSDDETAIRRVRAVAFAAQQGAEHLAWLHLDGDHAPGNRRAGLPGSADDLRRHHGG